MINHAVNQISPASSFFFAGIMGAVTWLAQAIPEVPDWMSNSALGFFILTLLFAVRTLWVRNQTMANEMKEMAETSALTMQGVTEKFHKEVKEEMQAQIDGERESRGEQTKAAKELADILREIRQDRVNR
jgi:hypothetical protein